MDRLSIEVIFNRGVCRLLFGELFPSVSRKQVSRPAGVCLYVLRSAAFNPIAGAVRVLAGGDYGIRQRCDMRWPICSTPARLGSPW